MEYILSYHSRIFPCISLLCLALASIDLILYNYNENYRIWTLNSEPNSFFGLPEDGTCHDLLDDGSFLDDDTWQPRGGCKMHYYVISDAIDCLRSRAYKTGRRNWFLFIGDSRILELYQMFGKVFGVPLKEHHHIDYHHVDLNIGFQHDFIWTPNITSNTSLILEHLNNLDIEERPTLLVIGCALWSIRDSNSSQNGLDEYKHNVTDIHPLLRGLTSSTLVLWREQYPIAEELRYFMNYWNFITNKMVDMYNAAASEILKEDIKIWKSSRKNAAAKIDLYDDAYHSYYGQRALDAQILANLYCNNITKRSEKSCCTNNKMKISKFSA